MFLWAFLDKAFALGLSAGHDPETGVADRFGDAAWVNGGSPTEGFLSYAVQGPFADPYTSIAGAAWADWLFMVGLLGIGAALMLGVAMRIAAASGALLLMLMWTAVLPPENNPFTTDHSSQHDPQWGGAVGAAPPERPRQAPCLGPRGWTLAHWST